MALATRGRARELYGWKSEPEPDGMISGQDIVAHLDLVGAGPSIPPDTVQPGNA